MLTLCSATLSQHSSKAQVLPQGFNCHNPKAATHAKAPKITSRMPLATRRRAELRHPTGDLQDAKRNANGSAQPEQKRQHSSSFGTSGVVIVSRGALVVIIEPIRWELGGDSWFG